MTARRFCFEVFLIAVVMGCGEVRQKTEEQGAIDLALSFAGDALPVEEAVRPDLRFKVRIEWTGGKAENEGDFDPGSQVKVSDVPNGEGRQAVVEVFNAAGKIYYHGKSGKFSVRAGLRTTVAVELHSSPEGGPLKVKEAGDGQYVNSPAVTLKFSVVRGTRVMAANDLGFSSPQERALTVLDRLSESEYEFSEWDLDSGTPCDRQGEVGSANPCQGWHTVYIKLLDEEGYESGIYSAQVNVDTSAPVIVYEAVAPEFATAGAEVVVSFSAGERLSELPVPVTEPELPGGGGLELATQSADLTAFTFKYTAPEQGDDGDYTVKVSVEDLAGNSAVRELSKRIKLDLTAPQVSNVSLSPPTDTESRYVRLADRGKEIRLEFDVSELLSQPTPGNFSGSLSARRNTLPSP